MNKVRNGLPIGLGIPTILVIFVVLGMTILSTLTWLEASQNRATAKKEAEHIHAYYEADALASYICERIKQGTLTLEEQKQYQIEKRDSYYYFTIEIEDQKQISIKINQDGTIDQWTITKEDIE